MESCCSASSGWTMRNGRNCSPTGVTADPTRLMKASCARGGVRCGARAIDQPHVTATVKVVKRHSPARIGALHALIARCRCSHHEQSHTTQSVKVHTAPGATSSCVMVPCEAPVADSDRK